MGQQFLLFWLSLVPFTTDWMGEAHFARDPVIVYGIVLLMAAVAFYILVVQLRRLHGPDSALAKALGSDWKGKVSPVLYVLGILGALLNPYVACAIYALVAALWFIPDRRIERQMQA